MNSHRYSRFLSGFIASIIAISLLIYSHAIGPVYGKTNDGSDFLVHDRQSDLISDWLPAQGNSLDPWADLGLRSGLTFLDFEGGYSCSQNSSSLATGTVTQVDGYSNKAIQLNYDLGGTNGNWVQIQCNFVPALDLSNYDHLRFDWRGYPSIDPQAANSLQVGLVDSQGHNFFGQVTYRHVTHHSWWGQLVVPFSLFKSSPAGIPFDPAHVSAIFISVVKSPKDSNDVDDIGGVGNIAIDNLNAYNVRLRAVPDTFENINSNRIAAQRAAQWLASMQRPSGLLKSWEEDESCLAYIYDQALALIVFADAGMWSNADALVDALSASQNIGVENAGSWYQSYICNTPVTPNTGNIWAGDIAWAVYALSQYLSLGGTHTQAATALHMGADWLAARINPADNNCLLINNEKVSTEGTLDVWWALQAAGTSHAEDAIKIKNCLMFQRWDETMGMFKGSQDDWRPYLDNQTWGAAFLKAIGETGKARQALSYAWEVLRLPSQDGQLFGLDGNAGPWSVWNEGTAQYIAVGGKGANDLLAKLLSQQREDGAMIGSPDEFSGGGVWDTHMHGVAPTAWLYNALCGEPFHPGSQTLCSPTFADVPVNYWAWDFVERLYTAGITGGCGNGLYCPTNPVTRAQMAVFLLRGIHGSSYAPPAVGASTGFSDVPTDYWAAAWIKQLAADGITSGCGAGIYCPDATVTRAQMAVFLLKAKFGTGFAPSAATGVFSDVPITYWAAAWIERLAAEAITSGCGGGLYCPDNPVTRDQMAVFIVKTFNLP